MYKLIILKILIWFQFTGSLWLGCFENSQGDVPCGAKHRRQHEKGTQYVPHQPSITHPKHQRDYLRQRPCVTCWSPLQRLGSHSAEVWKFILWCIQFQRPTQNKWHWYQPSYFAQKIYLAKLSEQCCSHQKDFEQLAQWLWLSSPNTQTRRLTQRFKRKCRFFCRIFKFSESQCEFK